MVDGYYVCQECGTLGEACIESEAEWRVFSKDENRNDSSRCGESSNSYLTVNDQAEGTVISCKWKESEKMRNARQYHKWNSCNANGRNLYVIFDEFPGDESRALNDFLCATGWKFTPLAVEGSKLFPIRIVGFLEGPGSYEKFSENLNL